MKLGYRKVIFVGFAFFLISAFWQAYDTIIPKILTDKFGMSQSWSGLVMGLDNVMGLFLLPLFGSLSDRCESPRGKRTPFIVVGTLLSVAFFILLSFVEGAQIQHLDAVMPENPTAQETLYDAALTVSTPDGSTIVIQDEFSKEEFTAITIRTADGSVNPDYSNFVVPARQTYAAAATAGDRTPFVIFMVALTFLLLSMATFRSPAVALMPDVTIKPLRSRANAVINLMGAAGGILVLLLGAFLGTGNPVNALMSYKLFFTMVAGLMLLSLAVFLWQVKEPKLVAEMQEESRKFQLDNVPDEEEQASGDGKLSKGARRSLILILASVVLWFFGYNAVTSKYSVYASSVLNLDYNLTLMIATGAAIVSYLPVGALASKIGRKKTILIGIAILGVSFLCASFIRAGSSTLVMNLLFASAGVGWATINVNSYPMVIELSQGGEVGKFTGFYYTASMGAQTLTPYISGLFMDKVSMTSLFPYGCICVLLSFVTMLFVRHGDSRPTPASKVR